MGGGGGGTRGKCRVVGGGHGVAGSFLNGGGKRCLKNRSSPIGSPGKTGKGFKIRQTVKAKTRTRRKRTRVKGNLSHKEIKEKEEGGGGGLSARLEGQKGGGKKRG